MIAIKNRYVCDIYFSIGIESKFYFIIVFHAVCMTSLFIIKEP